MEKELKDSGSVEGNTGEEASTVAAPPLEEATPAINEVVTPQVVESIVAAHDADLDVVDFFAEMGTQAGDNYMSIMYAVKIKVKSKSTGVEDILHIMLKTIPRNSARREMINELMAFEKESKMYSQVFVDFVNFQKEKGLEKDEIFAAYPICYSFFCDGINDYLAMQDLRVCGFRMANRQEGVDMNHIELVVRNLAKFHAISFAMFQGEYDKILEKYPYLTEKMFNKDDSEVEPMMKMFMAQTFISEATSLKNKNLDKEAELVQSVNNDRFFSNMKSLIGGKVKRAVIGHGDCWTNNQLFTYDEGAGKPTGHVFLDFQLSRACSRTIDLLYFIHTSPKIEILNNDQEKILRMYHEEFTSFALKLGYVNEDLTFESLLEEYDDFRDYGIITGLLLAPAMNAAKEDVPDMEKLVFDKDKVNHEEAEFFASMLKSDATTKRLINFAHNHILKLKAYKVSN